MFAKYIMKKPRVFKIWNTVLRCIIKKLTAWDVYHCRTAGQSCYSWVWSCSTI